jgi:hypothetical protein
LYEAAFSQRDWYRHSNTPSCATTLCSKTDINQATEKINNMALFLTLIDSEREIHEKYRLKKF